MYLFIFYTFFSSKVFFNIFFLLWGGGGEYLGVGLNASFLMFLFLGGGGGGLNASF